MVSPNKKDVTWLRVGPNQYEMKPTHYLMETHVLGSFLYEILWFNCNLSIFVKFDAHYWDFRSHMRDSSSGLFDDLNFYISCVVWMICELQWWHKLHGLFFVTIQIWSYMNSCNLNDPWIAMLIKTLWIHVLLQFKSKITKLL
jgi:hypothetical protein